jgi:hypothetical protein
MQASQISGANPDVMDGPPALFARRLRIQMDASRADFHEDIAGAAEVAIEVHLRAQRTNIPVDGRVQIARKKMDVMKMNH